MSEAHPSETVNVTPEATNTAPGLMTAQTQQPHKITCAGGCKHHNTWRTVMTIPLLLLIGGFAAVALFPQLAEYAAPVLGLPAGRHHRPANSN